MAEHATVGVIVKNLLYIPAAFLLGGIDPTSYAILTAFMALDLVLGVTRAIYLGGGQAFKSYKLGAGVVSKCTVVIAPLIVVWAGHGAGVDLMIMAKWCVGALILSQAYSMLGHINAIRVGQDASEWDAVSVILVRLRRAFEVLLKDGHSKK